MPAGPLAFKETDLARALRAANKVAPGAFTVRIERATGDIVVLPLGRAVVQGEDVPPPSVRPPVADDDLDEELAAWRAERS